MDQARVNEFIVPTPWPAVNDALAGGLTRRRTSLVLSADASTLARVADALVASSRAVRLSFATHQPAVACRWLAGPWLTANRVRRAIDDTIVLTGCDLLVVDGLEWSALHSWQQIYHHAEACRVLMACQPPTNQHVVVLWWDREPERSITGAGRFFDYVWTVKTTIGTRLSLHRSPEATVQSFWL